MAVSATLVACGGGSTDTAGSEAGANTNPLAEMRGTYVVACFNRNPGDSESEQGTITITAPAGGSEVDVSVRAQSYVGSIDCNASTLDSEGTATGRLTSKSNTRVYTDPTGKNVTAKVLTVAYTGLTLSKGSFSGTLPMLGATTDIAYVLDGKNLYLAKGGRGADGLGDSLSPRAAVKQ